MKPIFALLAALLVLSACSRGENPDELFGPGAGSGTGIDASADELLAGLDSRGIEQNSLQFFNEVIGDRVLFQVDQSTLDAEAQRVLNLQAAWLSQRPGAQVLIEGHADEQGTRDYNIALSARRASAVRDYLVTRGIPDTQLSTIPFGKDRPISVCSDESCYSQNRRAVTVVTGGLGV